MDFQSAARFGERRVMVTDYDETAVEVNAKVVDEDTGEVICKSGGGGGESDFSTAKVTIINTSDSPTSIASFSTCYLDADEETGEQSIVNDDIVANTGSSVTQNVILYKRKSILSFIDKGTLQNYEGNVTPEDEGYIINGDCTFRITGTAPGQG